MAVTVTSTISGPYLPNGATTVFPFDFKAGSADEIQVYRDLADGWELVPGANYTASVDPDQEGGDVEFSVAPAIGTGEIYIVSEPLFTREGQYTGEGPFTPKGLNYQFDKAAVRDLALARDVSRSIKVPLGEEPTTLPRSADRALKYMAFDANADPIPVDGVIDLVLNEAVGVPAGSSDLGDDFSTIIPPNPSAKQALQALESATENKAEKDLSDVASEDFAGKVFAQPLGTTDASLAQRFSHVINLQDDCGGVGENVTMNTGALTDAINMAQAAAPSRGNMPVGIYVPPGLYKYDAALPAITKSVVLFSDATRSCQLVPVGNFDALKFQGAGGARCAHAGLRNIALNGSGMTGGNAILVDWAQDFLLDNVLVADPYNALNLRQVGGTKLRGVRFDGVRNQGLYAFANNTARNGENDQIDVLSFEKCVFGSNYVAGGAASAVPLMVLDGRVHTIDVAGLRLLNAGKGLVTANTPGLASNLVPRFLTGYGLEAENMYSECLDIPVARDFWMAGLFAVGSQTGDGIKLGAAVNGFKVFGGNIDSNYLSGLDNIGATDVLLVGAKVTNNSLVGSGVKSQIHLGAGSGSFTMLGGLAGKDQSMPAYTEHGKYGIEIDAAYAGVARGDGIDLRGNVTGPIYNGGTSALGTRFTGCRGFNPAGTALQAVGASPFTYTAGLTQEHVNLYGGTGVVSTIDGVAVANASPCAFVLQPRQSVTITHTGAPTMAVNKE